MSALFSPLQIKDVQFKNRIAVSPMCQYSAEDGFANDWHLVHLGSRAVGGAGLIMMEATAVSESGRGTPADLGIWKDEHISFLKCITTFIDENDAVAGIQLIHAGRKASRNVPWKENIPLARADGGWQVYAPSAIPFGENSPVPEALTKEQIAEIVKDFGKAALRAQKAGFKVLEIHAAHGYLIHEFLSPVSNQRIDKYGGSFENRIRFLLEIIEEIHKNWPQNLPLFVRISATDWLSEGWNENDSVALAVILKTKGVDLIDCSTGGILPTVSIPVEPLYQVKFADIIKKESLIKTAAVGLITSAIEAEAIVKNEQADLVFIARELLRNPYFPIVAAQELGVDLTWPNQYARAKLRK
ncbi:NADPH dehydrogenase NamA [Epilithonimonas hungarica]|uniref:2,4-dienoyl-CoA reductase n=1 Tax=Epilithonimonas hungarica TaxID=454006 RepID=A0A1G7SDM7_9FLAO|nr:NADPH dehydrogenase NamA [Epilithonimonas hungarica]SDG20529.1 2,4-dienoyl-CoA reductase [Epilithonimonas hungarica]